MRGKDRGTVYVSPLTVAALSLLAGPGGTDAPDPSDDAGADDLADALDAHPWASDGDQLAAHAHAPLPASLEAGLGELVHAHQRALATGDDAALPTAAAEQAPRLRTGAEALAASDPAPELPPGEPVNAEAALAESLVELYEAIGIGEPTLSTLEPRVETATERLPPDDRRALASLVAAQARYQADALAVAHGLSTGQRLAAEDARAMQASLADLHATIEALAAEGPWIASGTEAWTEATTEGGIGASGN